MNKIVKHPAQTKDFIHRTQCVIEQYEQVKFAKPEINYCNTLFLNTCFSLISICKIEMTESQKPFISKFPDSIVTKKRWGIDPSNIEFVRDDIKSVQNIIEGIRDCLDHNKFEANYGGEECTPINWIRFENGTKFKAEFIFEDFKTFVLEVAKFTQTELEKNV